MGITIAKKGVREPARYLIANGVEKYRMVIGNQLVYAKGKINLNLNNIYYDSNGIAHNVFLDFTDAWKEVPSYLFAFLNEGFYKESREKYNKYCNNLSEIINNISKNGQRDRVITFKGWYLSADGKGRSIDKIEDIQKYTNLFEYKKEESLPEITLYACWIIPTYTLVVHNIIKHGYDKLIAKSSFYDKQKKKTFVGDSSTFTVSYNTSLQVFLQNNISSVSYITWAKNALDGTSSQQALRNGPQRFLGWTNKQYVYDSTNVSFNLEGFDLSTLISDINNLPKRINVYPQFESIIIFKKANFKKNTFYYKGNSKKKVKTAGGFYLLRTGLDDTTIKAENTTYNDLPSEFFRFTKKKDGSYKKHYRYVWAPPEKVDYYSTMLDGGRIPYSSTIVFKIRSVTPYGWQKDGNY